MESLPKEKGLKGINATWTLMELLQGTANDRITRKLGPKLLTLEDPEEIISELEKIYDEAGGFRRAQQEFRDRDQSRSESIREYMDALQSLLHEIDPHVSQVSLNTTVFTRFIEGLRHKELHTSSSKHLLHAKANRLDKKSSEYLEEILKVAEAELETAKQERRSNNPSSSKEPVKDLREERRTETANPSRKLKKRGKLLLERRRERGRGYLPEQRRGRSTELLLEGKRRLRTNGRVPDGPGRSSRLLPVW